MKESEGVISALAMKLPIVSPGKMKKSQRKNQAVVRLLNMSTQSKTAMEQHVHKISGEKRERRSIYKNQVLFHTHQPQT